VRFRRVREVEAKDRRDQGCSDDDRGDERSLPATR
jgi:hypothetical protein